jgi:hypothetical protein
MLPYPESTLQLCSSRRFCEVFKDLFRFPVSRPDDVVFRPDAHQSVTSVRTTRSFRPNAHQCKDAVNRDSTFRVMSRLEENSSSLSAVWTMCHPVRTPICLLLHPSGRCVIPFGRQTVQHHPSGRRASSVRTLHCIEKFLFQLDPSGRLNNKSGRLSVLERFTDSFQIQEREDQSTVRTMWYPVRTRVSIRQESQFEFDRLNA